MLYNQSLVPMVGPRARPLTAQRAVTCASRFFEPCGGRAEH